MFYYRKDGSQILRIANFDEERSSLPRNGLLLACGGGSSSSSPALRRGARLAFAKSLFTLAVYNTITIHIFYR